MSLGTETIIFDELVADPSTPAAGEVWYNVTDVAFKYYDGSSTHVFSEAADLLAHISDTGNPHQVTLEQARSQDNTVSGSIDMGGNTIQNVGNASLTTDGVNLQQVRDEIRLRIDSLDFQESVLDKDILDSSLIVSPALDDRYLILGTGSNDFLGHDNEIAQWNGSAWEFITPDEGFQVPVEDESNANYRYTAGVWSLVPMITDHGGLSGLTDDDHPQYILANGSRAFTNDLDVGTNDIVNVGTVDGVDVSAHAARHIRGGADEIDGDQVDIDYAPTNYTPNTSPAVVSSTEHLSAHLAGLDDAIGAIDDNRKAGSVPAGSFAGTPRIATVAFTTAYPSTNYVVGLTPVTTGRGYSVRVLNKTVSGFTIRLGSNNTTPLVSVDWHTDLPNNP